MLHLLLSFFPFPGNKLKFIEKNRRCKVIHNEIQRNIYFLVNTFVQHTFRMSKSSIKTKTVLTMTDITESTKLLAFKRQMDSYKVTVNIYLCICVVPS